MNVSKVLLAGTLLLQTPLQGDTARTLPPFVLEDQHGQHSRADDVRGRWVVVVGGDRDARDAAAQWSMALRHALESRDLDPAEYALLRVADVRGVPAIFRPIARRMVRDRYEVGLLLDWEGQLAAPYDFTPGEAHLLFFDRSGRLVAAEHGAAPSAHRAEELVERLLRSPSRPPFPPHDPLPGPQEDRRR